MDFAAAEAYVRNNGRSLDLARLEYMLSHTPPPAEVTEQLFAGQRPDGGWPASWSGDQSSLDATCFRLALAAELGLNSSQFAITQAVNFLSNAQHPDGTWEENLSQTEFSPDWDRPGEESSRLYLTANCAFWEGIIGMFIERATRGAGYLEQRLDEQGRLPSFVQANWLAGALWHRMSWRAPEEMVFKYLESRLDSLSASDLAWMVVSCYQAGVPTSSPLIQKAARRLEGLQETNGMWPSSDDPEMDVHTTLEAMLALRLSGIASL